MALEMTSTKDTTVLGIDQENPIVAAARKHDGGTVARGHVHKPAAPPIDLDLGNHVDAHVVEEGGDDEEIERVTIGGQEWRVNAPARRSTINVFEGRTTPLLSTWRWRRQGSQVAEPRHWRGSGRRRRW